MRKFFKLFLWLLIGFSFQIGRGHPCGQPNMLEPACRFAISPGSQDPGASAHWFLRGTERQLASCETIHSGPAEQQRDIFEWPKDRWSQILRAETQGRLEVCEEPPGIYRNRYELHGGRIMRKTKSNSEMIVSVQGIKWNRREVWKNHLNAGMKQEVLAF